MTRCKVTCNAVTKRQWGTAGEFIYEAEFQPIYGNSPENEAFFKATPGGQIKLSTIRDDHFTPGKAYYVDFTEA